MSDFENLASIIACGMRTPVVFWRIRMAALIFIWCVALFFDLLGSGVYSVEMNWTMQWQQKANPSRAMWDVVNKEDTGFGGNGGEYWAPPKKQWIRRTSDLVCFLVECFSTLIFHSYVDTIFTWLILAMITRRRHLKHNINPFVGGCVPKIFPTFHIFHLFLLS